MLLNLNQDCTRYNMDEQKTPIRFKLGKLPAVKNSVSFRLRDYLALSKLPATPTSAGHLDLVTEHNMYGNDKYGDCVCAEAGHTTHYWNMEANRKLEISTKNVLAMYTDITGFNPDDPDTDQGTSMPDAAKWRQKVGLIDEKGVRHTIDAYLALTPGNTEELKQAIYLFGGVGIGWELPESAQEQFQEGKPWSVVPGSEIEGGHDTAAVGYDADYIYIITWGKIQKVEWAFFARYCDEGIIYFSEENILEGRTLEGFNLSQLQADLKEL